MTETERVAKLIYLCKSKQSWLGRRQYCSVSTELRERRFSFRKIEWSERNKSKTRREGRGRMPYLTLFLTVAILFKPLFDQWATTCDCGSPVNNSGYHLLTCKLHGGPVREHDSIVSVWSTCLRSVGVYHKQEVRNRYVDMFWASRHSYF